MLKACSKCVGINTSIYAIHVVLVLCYSCVGSAYTNCANPGESRLPLCTCLCGLDASIIISIATGISAC